MIRAEQDRQARDVCAVCVKGGTGSGQVTLGGMRGKCKGSRKCRKSEKSSPIHFENDKKVCFGLVWFN